MAWVHWPGFHPEHSGSPLCGGGPFGGGGGGGRSGPRCVVLGLGCGTNAGRPFLFRPRFHTGGGGPCVRCRYVSTVCWHSECMPHLTRSISFEGVLTVRGAYPSGE